MDGLQRGEREFLLRQAARRALLAIDELSLVAQMECYGGDPTVWSCQLWDGSRPVPWGLGHGKGEPAAARVGALYEALEHYVVQQHRADTIELYTCAQIAESALSSEAYARILAEQPNELIACRTYQQIGGSDRLPVPLFLSNVWWAEEQTVPQRTQIGDTTDYRSLARYSSNNGSAIGGSFAEAAVHAINETIERDAMSLFLVRSYVAATPSPPRFYDNATLPDDLRRVLETVQTRLGREVWLIDLTTDLGVPTTLAYTPGPHGNFQRGHGTSLSRYHSMYRALTELLEVALTSDKIGDRRTAIELFADHPILQACVAFEIDAPTTGSPRVAFVDNEAPRSPNAHLEQLVAALSQQGFNAYAYRVQAFVSGITTVHIHIPGLEHFHLITDGPSAVVPGHRGAAAATSNS